MDDACGKHGQQEGDTDADTNSEFVPTANTISAMEAFTLQNQVQLELAKQEQNQDPLSIFMQRHEAKEAAAKAKEGAPADAANTDEDKPKPVVNHGATLSSMTRKELKNELARALQEQDHNERLLEDLEEEDEREQLEERQADLGSAPTPAAQEASEPAAVPSVKQVRVSVRDHGPDSRITPARPRGRTNSIEKVRSMHGVKGPEGSMLTQLRTELEHLNLLTNALQAKEAKAIQVELLQRKVRILGKLAEKRQEAENQKKDERQNIREYAFKVRNRRQSESVKETDVAKLDELDGTAMKGLEAAPAIVNPAAWGPLKYGWLHCLFLILLFASVVTSVVIMSVAKPLMPHEGLLFGHVYGLGPGIPSVHPLDKEPLDRVEIELILPKDPAMAGGHKRLMRRSLLSSPQQGLGLGLGRTARLDTYVAGQALKGQSLGGRRMLLATDNFGARPDSSADDHPNHTHYPVDVAHDEDEYENTTSHAEIVVYLEQQGEDLAWTNIDQGHSFALRDTSRMHHLILRPKKSPEYNSSQPLRVSVEAGWKMHGHHLVDTELLPFEMKGIRSSTWQMWQFGMLGDAQPWIALAVLLVVLGLIALEVIHRMLVAMAGAFVMLGLLLICDKAPDLMRVVEFVDEGALALLFGMMILVGKLASTGVFEVVTFKLVGLSRGNTFYLMAILCSLTAVLSAFLDNVTTVLLLAPVTTRMCKQLDIPAAPFLIAETLFSNIGGTATLIGDPPNIIIGNALSYEIGFMDFLKVMMPGVLIISPFVMVYLRWFYRVEVSGSLKRYDDVLRMGKTFSIKDPKLLNECLIVLGGVILLFVLHPVHHVNPAWIAVLGSVGLMLISSGHNVHHDLQAVDWDVLLFFAALFVMVESMGEAGLIRGIGDILTSLIESIPADGRTAAAITILIWCSAIISAFLDNIPYTATMVPVIEQLANAGIGVKLAPLAWALAFGACLGGNGSLIGASANIVVAGIASREDVHISFVTFLKAGFPVMVLSAMFANAYMLMLYA